MIRYENQPLQYLPERNEPGIDFAGPMQAYQAHQKDLRAQEEAKQMMALRQREQGFREDQGAQEMAMRGRDIDRGEQHQNRRDALAEKEEGRRASSVVFDRKRLEHEDIEKWAHLMAYGSTPAEREYAASMLKGMYGLQVEPLLPEEPAASAQTTPARPAQNDPTLGGTLQADDAQPMGHVGASKPGDAALSSELDNIDQTYSKGLGVAPGAAPKYLPGGRSLAAKRSDLLLSEGDSLNK